MIEGKKILQFFGIAVFVLLITFVLSWMELLSRAKNAYEEGNTYLMKADEANKTNNLETAYNSYREALWSFQTVEQLLTSGTRKYVAPNTLEPGMLLADPVYPDGLREAEIERQNPKEIIADSYIPLTQEQIEKIKTSPNLTEVTIPEAYSIAQNSKWIAMAKEKIPYCKEMIAKTRPVDL
ncbi:hypothetical protein HZA55_05390 [Candidatus Poribacteria bacterium]|nr:hypothetical protein [Candidatus Poribacteria bacterium]